MTTETVLDELKIHELIRGAVAPKIIDGKPIGPEDWIDFARAVEQAVLQSPEIQALKKDAYRFQWLIENTDIGVGMDNGYTVIDTREDVDRIMEILPCTK